MPELKHTPGPWHWDGPGLTAANGFPILRWEGWSSPDDLRLIAAAPEMYAELDRLMDVLCEDDQAIIGALLDRIRGETE